jgi:hypothetical protein
MFFYIGDNCPIKSMTQVQPRLFLDEGWSQLDGIWYKGYSTDCNLSESLFDILAGYHPAGKWCVIFNEQVYHPVLRGFPLYQNTDIKTNLTLEGLQPNIYEVVPFEEDSELSLDEVSDRIGDILIENTRNFLKYNNITDLTVIFSGGLDTLTAWTVVDQVTKDYTLSMHVADSQEHAISILGSDQDKLDVYLSSNERMKRFLGTEQEYESDLTRHAEQNYWGYQPACIYKENNWHVTGYYAEVYTYRDGEAINAIANYQGKRIDELASEDEYLYWFLKRPNIVEKYKNSQMTFNNDTALKQFLWETVWYDHQMWHLDNNMRFSPFADLRVIQMVSRLSVKDITHCCVTGQIQKNIIKRFRPDLLPILSDYKNAKDIWGNFRANFNESMLHPDTKLIHR